MRFTDKVIDLIKANEKYILRWILLLGLIVFWASAYRFVAAIEDTDAEIIANKF